MHTLPTLTYCNSYIILTHLHRSHYHVHAGTSIHSIEIQVNTHTHTHTHTHHILKQRTETSLSIEPSVSTQLWKWNNTCSHQEWVKHLQCLRLCSKHFPWSAWRCFQALDLLKYFTWSFEVLQPYKNINILTTVCTCHYKIVCSAESTDMTCFGVLSTLAK